MTDDRTEGARIDRQLMLTLITVAGLALAMAGRFLIGGTAGDTLLVAGSVAAYAAGGIPSAARAWLELYRERVLDIDLLMVVAALAAAAVGAPIEGAVLLTLFSISNTLEARAMGRARRAVEALMSLRPETAFRKLGDGSVEEVPASALVAGDRVMLRPGARVPADGVIRSSRASLDESTITGESMPVTKEAGQPVFEATVNLAHVVEVEVLRPVAESTVARMITLVTEAQAERAPSEAFSDWFGRRYTVGVLAASLIAFGAFLALGRQWDDALYRAATLLVASSPCAIVISVPAAILSALSAAARGGVLFKGGVALETLAAVDIFTFDKTGTLTTGRAAITAVVPIDGDEASLLSLLGGLEAHSEHHIAGAVRRELEERKLAPAAVTSVVALPSAGIEGREGASTLWAGNARMLALRGIDPETTHLDGLLNGAQTVIYVGRDDRLLGAVSVADEVRETSAAAIAELREGGVREVAILTGDRRPVALRIGRELGLSDDEVVADMLPADKVEHIADLARRGRVAFVGDGVNDAAALARADVGIAMGVAGSEVALQAADVALMSEDMARLAAAHRLARRTARIIRQNLAFAMLAMAALVTGSLFFELPLPLAVIGHEGGTVLVVLNGLRLLADPIRSASR